MAERKDPLVHAADGSTDLHGIATWEPRSLLDRFFAHYTVPLVRLSVVLVAALLFGVELLLIVLQVISSPGSILVVVLFPLSVIPALLIAGYVWYTDITSEPWLLLIATYVLGVLLATFPTVTNTVTAVLIDQFVPGGLIGYIVSVAHFYLVVAPGEEAAKLGAVFAYVYWKDDFDTVVDGAVYGAVAGLGFATIENATYILRVLADSSGVVELVLGGGVITVLRSIAGPGHVIWTGIAGYYLGLAKFNDEHTLPLILKGLFVAILLHGTYNSVLTSIDGVAGVLGSGSPILAGVLGLGLTVGFILVFHTLSFGYLFVRLRRYRKAYAEASPGEDAAPVSELDGYE